MLPGRVFARHVVRFAPIAHRLPGRGELGAQRLPRKLGERMWSLAQPRPTTPRLRTIRSRSAISGVARRLTAAI
jgi:hypothetical protein